MTKKRKLTLASIQARVKKLNEETAKVRDKWWELYGEIDDAVSNMDDACDSLDNALELIEQASERLSERV